MKNNHMNRLIAIIALVVALIGLSVGLATISTTLSINGSANIYRAEWSVKFDSLSSPVIKGDAIVESNPSLTDTYIGGFYVKLIKPGDSVSYTFDIVNSGTMDAVIGTFSKSEPNFYSASLNADDILLASENLVYTLTYTDTERTVQVGDVLNRGEEVNVTLTVGYNSNASSLPSETIEIRNLNMSIIYNQK